MTKYQFIGKTVYFPKLKILAIGDLHLGYEYMFEDIIKTQSNQTYKDLNEIFSKGLEIKKVILLGDIKHFFSYEKFEKNLIQELMLELSKHINQENIILIKGNHERILRLNDRYLLPFYIESDVCFIHGDTTFSEIFDKKIKTIVMAHLHPAINLTDKQNIKSEKYKCFLTGKYKGKEIIIVPSFFPLVEGTAVNVSIDDTNSIIPAKTLMNFDVHVIGEDILNFGKLKKLYKP